MKSPTTLFSALSLTALLSAAGELRAQPDFVEPFLERYCIECHVGDTADADIDFDMLGRDLDAFLDPTSAAVWHEVRDSLNLSEMPPKKADYHPTPEERVQMANWVAEALKYAESKATSTGGEVVIRRMSRLEYHNTIRDLTGLEWTRGESPREVLPDDTAVHDFKKVGIGLTLDASLMEGYADFAQIIAKRTIAVTDEPEFPNLKRRQTWASNGYHRKRLESSDLAYGVTEDGHAILRGGKFYPPHFNFGELHYRDTGEFHPVKGKYIARFRAWSRNARPDEPVTLTFGSFDKVQDGQFELILSDEPRVFEFPYFVDVNGAPGSDHPNGQVLNGTAIVNDDTTPMRRLGLDKGRNQRGGGAELSREDYRDNLMRITRRATEGFFHSNDIPGPALLALDENPHAVLDWIEIEGPVEPWPPLVQQNHFTAADGSFDLEGGVAEFMERAFRRPVGSGELSQMLDLARAEAEKHDSERMGARAAVASILTSPHFLYVSAPDLTTTESDSFDEQAGPYELASRMSYFLWSAPPDDRLLALAASGEILDSEVRRGEVDRMLADPRAEALSEGFATQWLRVDQFNAFEPSTELYGKFEGELLSDMELEAIAFFQEVLHNDRPVLSFLHSDFAVLNERLADYYEIEGVEGEEFRPVPLPPDSKRGGLLGMAGVHRLGSDGVRTKPVTRGVYVKEVVFNDPPNPPPPNAGEIPPNADGENLTVKERLLAHKEIESCAACHRTIDPYGVALENFDVVGQWREVQNGENFNKRNAPPIDPGGEFTDGRTFATYEEFIERLVEDEKRFRMALVEKFATYALGRDLLPHDEGEIERIAEATVADGDRMRVLIKELVAGRLFSGS